MLLVTADTLRDAALYAGIAVAAATLSFAGPPQRRRGPVVLAAFALLMVGALWVLVQWGDTLPNRTLYEIAREATLALLAVAVMRAVLQVVAGTLLSRFHVPPIVTDVLLGLALIAYALVRLNVVGVNLAGIVTTSAVITGAIAFSAQEVLGALWAGLSLQAERTLRLGDWIRFGGSVGQIETIRWRTTTIRTPANEAVIIPNALLIKERVQIILRTGGREAPRREIPFFADYDHTPGEVIRVVTEALRMAKIANVLADPEPRCVCTGFDDSAIDYEAHYWLADYDNVMVTDSEVRSHVFAALQRAGIRIPFPQRDVHVDRASPEGAMRREMAIRLRVLSGIELFDGLNETERDALAAALERLPFADGGVLFRKGDAADSLYVLAAGRLAVYDEGGDRGRRLLARVVAPDYVGEMGLLTGQPRGATVVADGEVMCYRVDKAGFDSILRRRPEIVDQLSQVLARRQADNDATLAALSVDDRGQHARSRARELVRRIRQFFALGS
jgi:small-conductance mechanosensitive channel/CRP-like cAMP-binding protein